MSSTRCYQFVTIENCLADQPRLNDMVVNSVMKNTEQLLQLSGVAVGSCLRDVIFDGQLSVGCTICTVSLDVFDNLDELLFGISFIGIGGVCSVG